MQILRLYKLVPTDAQPKVIGTLSIPTDGLAVYGAWNKLPANRREVYTALQDNTIYGVDMYGTNLTVDQSTGCMAAVCDAAQSYDFSRYVYQVNWNLTLTPQLIAIVRSDVLSVSLSALGLTAVGLLTKLNPVTSAIQVGMFLEASQLLQGAIVRDAFLTEERIAKYVSLLTACDAVDPNRVSQL